MFANTIIGLEQEMCVFVPLYFTNNDIISLAHYFSHPAFGLGGLKCARLSPNSILPYILISNVRKESDVSFNECARRFGYQLPVHTKKIIYETLMSHIQGPSNLVTSIWRGNLFSLCPTCFLLNDKWNLTNCKSFSVLINLFMESIIQFFTFWGKLGKVFWLNVFFINWVQL